MVSYYLDLEQILKNCFHQYICIYIFRSSQQSFKRESYHSTVKSTRVSVIWFRASTCFPLRSKNCTKRFTNISSLSRDKTIPFHACFDWSRAFWFSTAFDLVPLCWHCPISIGAGSCFNDLRYFRWFYVVLGCSSSFCISGFAKKHSKICRWMKLFRQIVN